MGLLDRLRRPPATPHRYWDPGRGLGLHCAICGAPKPRLDQVEPPCLGQPQLESMAARGAALPSLVMAWSWVRMARAGHQIAPYVVRASGAAAMAPLARLGQASFEREVALVNQDAQKVYQAASADLDSRVHSLAVAVWALQLVSIGALAPDNQAALTSTAILEEASREPADWARPAEGELGRHASAMLATARGLGYYRDSVPPTYH